MNVNGQEEHHVYSKYYYSNCPWYLENNSSLLWAIQRSAQGKCTDHIFYNFIQQSFSDNIWCTRVLSVMLKHLINFLAKWCFVRKHFNWTEPNVIVCQDWESTHVRMECSVQWIVDIYLGIITTNFPNPLPVLNKLIDNSDSGDVWNWSSVKDNILWGSVYKILITLPRVEARSKVMLCYEPHLLFLSPYNLCLII